MELKPCPFCGCEDTHFLPPTARDSDPYDPRDRVYPVAICQGCFVEVAGNNDDHSSNCLSARKNWNARALPRTEGGAVEADYRSQDGWYWARHRNETVLGSDEPVFVSRDARTMDLEVQRVGYKVVFGAMEFEIGPPLRALPPSDCELREALEPFVSDVQWRALHKTILKASTDMDAVTVTVTVGQFKRARAAAKPQGKRE